MNPLQYSCLENSMERGAWRDIAMGSQSQAWLSARAHTHTHTHSLKTILYQYNCCVFHFQFSSVAQLYLTLCDPMNSSMPGLPVHHQLPESTQTHVHWVGDAIQPSHPMSSPTLPALNLSQHQCLFKWVSSLHQVAKVLEFQLHFHFQYSI